MAGLKSHKSNDLSPGLFGSKPWALSLITKIPEARPMSTPLNLHTQKGVSGQRLDQR